MKPQNVHKQRDLYVANERRASQYQARTTLRTLNSKDNQPHTSQLHQRAFARVILLNKYAALFLLKRREAADEKCAMLHV